MARRLITERHVLHAANVLTLGSPTMELEPRKRVLAEFLGTPYEGGRHDRRVQKLRDVEARFLRAGERGAGERDAARAGGRSGRGETGSASLLHPEGPEGPTSTGA